MLGPTPDDVALAEKLLAKAISQLPPTVSPDVIGEVRRSLLQELLESDEGLRKLRRLRAEEIRSRKAPSPPAHPDDLARLRDAGPPTPSTPAEDRQMDRTATISHILATRAVEAIKGALPPLLHDLLWFELADHIGMHPSLAPVVDTATSHWPVPPGQPDSRLDIFMSRPERGPNARLFAGMELSLSDFLLALPEPDPTATVASAASEAEHFVLALIAAMLTGALAAADRLKEEDRDDALAGMAEGTRLVEEHLASLDPAARNDFERVSMQLDLLPRHPTMDILEPEDARVHREAMIAFGAHLGTRLPVPLLAAPVQAQQ